MRRVSGMKNVAVRSIELHDTITIWSPEKIRKIVDFMVKYDMNTLVFHQNDIVDFMVYPSFLYSKDNKPIADRNIYNVYKQTWEAYYYQSPHPHVILDEKPIYLELIRYIVSLATSKGIDVYFQTKELWFYDAVFEQTGVMKNGVVCPCEPYWWETYLPVKYDEFFANFPEIAGIITSTATRESRASLAHGKCGCELCKNADMQEWQKKVIMSIYQPIKKHGKKLVIRDFSYYPTEQSGVRAGVLDLPDDIGISIKNVPQDFYPTFPHNALIGHVGNREQWIEYEPMGEYFGFGVVPCELLEDVRDRIKYALQNGATGFTSRVDWEALPNHSAFDTVNALNVYAAAMFSLDPDLPGERVYRAWLEDYGLFAENLSEEGKEACVRRMMEVLGKSQSVVFKSCYVKKFLFGTNSKIPADIAYQDFVTEEFHGLHKWFPEHKHDMDMTSENIASFISEKQEAIDEANRHYDLLARENPGLDETFYNFLLGQLDITKMYAEQFYVVAKVYFYAKGAEALRDYNGAKEALRELRVFEEKLAAYNIPVFVYPTTVLLCLDKLRYYRIDAEERMEEIYRDLK